MNKVKAKSFMRKTRDKKQRNTILIADAISAKYDKNFLEKKLRWHTEWDSASDDDERMNNNNKTANPFANIDEWDE